MVSECCIEFVLVHDHLHSESGKLRPGYVCSISHIHKGLSLHCSALSCNDEDDCTKNCRSF